MKSRPAHPTFRAGHRTSTLVLERKGTTAKRILLVDDDAALRRVCARILEAAGHTVDNAASAAEGAALYDRDRHDLVITDIVMPSMDGTALIKTLRAGKHPPKIVAISGGSKELPAEMGLRLGRAFGVDAVLYKPFLPDELLDLIDTL
jgi:CheY-like chemotaxis protein